MARHQYNNPPIQEALVEFRFEPSQEWDLTMPGRLHAELAASYPGKPRQQNVVEASLVAREGQAPNFEVRDGLGKVQLVTDDASRLVAMGPDVLSVHMLQPYQRKAEGSGWDEFRPRIVEALNGYWKVADPVGVQRIGLRYINKVAIPESSVEIGRYLRAAPPSVEGLPSQLRGFVARVEYTYDDEVRLVVSHATVDALEGQVAFLVDIDVIWKSEAAVGREKALDMADDLRVRERDVFEALITDEARRLFDAT